MTVFKRFNTVIKRHIVNVILPLWKRLHNAGSQKTARQESRRQPHRAAPALRPGTATRLPIFWRPDGAGGRVARRAQCRLPSPPYSMEEMPGVQARAPPAYPPVSRMRVARHAASSKGFYQLPDAHGLKGVSLAPALCAPADN